MRKKKVSLLAGAMLAGFLLLTAAQAAQAISVSDTSTGNPATNNQDPASPNSNADALKNPDKVSGGLMINAKASDTSDLNKLIDQIKSLGGKATQEATTNIGTAKSNSEADELRIQIGKDYAGQGKMIQSAIDKYKSEKAVYDKAMSDYNDAMSKVTNGEAGTLPDLKNPQNLKFISENNAVPTIDFNQGSYIDSQYVHGYSYVDSSGETVNFDGGHLMGAEVPNANWTVRDPEYPTVKYAGALLQPLQQVQITYTNLENTSWKGQRVASVAVKYTNTGSRAEGLYFPSAPTASFDFFTNAKNTPNSWPQIPVSMQASYTFKLSDGSTITFDNTPQNSAGMFIGSLNHTKGPKAGEDDVETTQGLNGFDYKRFAGSSVIDLGNTLIGSPGYNDWIKNGSKFNTAPGGPAPNQGPYWDIDDSIMYYAGIWVTPIRATTALSAQWNSSNVNMWAIPKFIVPNLEIPAYPTVEKPTPPEVTYHYETGLYAPPDVKSVTTLDGTDIDNKIVNKMSKVVWNLNLGQKLTDGREKTTSVVFSDPLPDGFVIDLDKTKSLSSAYTIQFDENTNTLTATLIKSEVDKLNADLEKDVALPTVKVAGQVVNDNSLYANGFTTSITDDKGKLDVNSNNVYVYTPGENPPGENPPDLPPTTPPSDNPPGTPELPPTTIINPVKDNQDGNGVSIDGDTIPADTVNYFTLLWDLDQYKGMTSDQSEVDKGFVYVDDYQDDDIIPDDSKVTFKDDSGKSLDSSLFTVKHYDSLSKAPQSVRDILSKAGITVDGAFQIFLPKDQKGFYKNYVQTGNSIHITTPMTIKAGFTGTFINNAYQVDFGNGYWSNQTSNKVVPPGDPDTPINPNTPTNPTPQGPVKDVSLTEDSETIDKNQGKDGLVEKGGNFWYELNSRIFQAGRAEIQSYGLTDDYDQTKDKLTNQFNVYAGEKRIGDQNSKLFTLTDKDGVLTFEASQEMIALINQNRTDDYKVTIEMEAMRLDASPAVENNFVDNVGTDANGDGKVDLKDPKENDPKTSNTVETNTPGEPEEPSKPNQPEEPKTPNDPDQPNNPNNPVSPENPSGPVKDVQKTDGTESIDINQGHDGTVDLSGKIVYELESSILKAGRGNSTVWSVKDDYQEKLDDYLDTYRVYVNGEKFGSQDDGYFTVKDKDGILTVKATDKFLAAVNAKTSQPIRWSINLDFKRTAASDSVLNQFTEVLAIDANNDGKVDPNDLSETSQQDSNEVKTKTPEPDKNNKNVLVNILLPHTGDEDFLVLTIAGVGLLGLAAGLTLRKKKSGS